MKKSFKVFLLLFILALVSRLLLLTVGYLYNGHWTSNWVHWDSSYYLQIAGQGYDSSYPVDLPEAAVCNQGTGYCQRNFAFFPLYPLSIKTVSDLTGLSTTVSGVLISDFAFSLAAVIIYQITKKMLDRKAALYACAFLMVFPFGYIFAAVMTESLFLLLLVLGYFLALQKKYLAAGICGALLAATRNTGVLFGLSLLLIMREQNGYRLTKVLKNWRMLLALLIVPLGLVGFMLFLHYRVNDPLAFINIQRYWEKPVLGLYPLFAIPFSLFDASLEGNLRNHLFNLGVFLVLAAVTVTALRKKLLPFSLSSILFWILVPLTAGTMLALPRYVSVLFPVYILFGILAKKRRKLAYFLLGASTIAMFILTVQYLKGAWLTV